MVSPPEFETQIIALKKAGFRFISLSEALQRARSKARAEQTVSITTDDGFACNHDTILPILKRHELPICVFIIGKCIDNRALAWNHKLLIVRARADAATLDKAVKSLAPQYQLSLSKSTAESPSACRCALKMLLRTSLGAFLRGKSSGVSGTEQTFSDSEQLRLMLMVRRLVRTATVILISRD
jgi:hypothetical protein